MATTRRGRLEGKVCIVTGAGSPHGIGWATIKRFAEEDAQHIYALDINNVNFGTLGAEFQANYPNVKITFVHGDVCDEGVIRNVCEAATQHDGRLDVFFANAGILGTAYDASSQDIDLETFMRVLKNNVGSAFLAVKFASQEMAKTSPAEGKSIGSGSIVLTASAAGIRAGFAPIPYCAGKAASINLAQNAAFEFLRNDMKVRVNAVAPGFMRTALLPNVLHEHQERNVYFSDPIAIANAVLYLASDESEFVNGETLVVDNTLSTGVRFDKILQAQ